jgi:hypothetical protein
MCAPALLGAQKPLNNPVWDDLISLQGLSTSSSLPLQYKFSPHHFLATQPLAVPNTNLYVITASAQYFAKILKEEDETELSVNEMKECKIMQLPLKIKNGTPPVCKTALQQITDNA